MRTRTPSRLVLAVVAVATLGAAPLSGCSGTNMSSATSALSSSAKELVQSYLKDSDSLTKLLGGISDPQKAMNSLPQLQTLVGKFANSSTSLSSLSSDVKNTIMSSFGKDLGKSNDLLSSQISRIKGTSGLSNILGQTLDKISLFK